MSVSSRLSPRSRLSRSTGQVGLGTGRAIQSRKLKKLVDTFRESTHLPDPAPLYVLLGTLAGNLLPGNPIWTMFVGAASGGGSHILMSAAGLGWVHEADRLSGVSALLSASSRKDVQSGASGGILRRIGPFGVLLMSDFTSVLSLPRDILVDVLGAFRKLYDGDWSRDVGVDGGRHLEWKGKMGMLAKCTSMIDRHHMVNAEMGERTIQYRFPQTDGFAASQKALERVESPMEIRRKLQEAVEEFMDGIGAEEKLERVRAEGRGEGRGEGKAASGEDGDEESDHQGGIVPLPSRTLTRIIALAMISARARSVVYRNTYTREVEDVSLSEAPPRLSQAIAQLERGMEMAEVGAEERWRVVGKVALDSVPPLRKSLLLGIAEHRHQGGLGVQELSGMKYGLGCSSQTVRRALEDLMLHDVLRVGKGGKASGGGMGGDVWELSDWAARQWEIAFPGGYEGAWGE